MCIANAQICDLVETSLGKLRRADRIKTRKVYRDIDERRPRRFTKKKRGEQKGRSTSGTMGMQAQ